MRNLAISVLLMGVLTACSSISSLGTASSQLDAASGQFSRQLHSERGTGKADSEAAALAEAAHDFNRAVGNRTSRQDLGPAFDRVSERYHRLRSRLVDREYRDQYEGAGFDRVTQAYLDVDRALNHP